MTVSDMAAIPRAAMPLSWEERARLMHVAGTGPIWIAKGTTSLVAQ